MALHFLINKASVNTDHYVGSANMIGFKQLTQGGNLLKK